MSESFDFGSCVALHRFLYDHWDHVRQKLAPVEQREYVRSPGEISRKIPRLEPLQNLVTILGPPPLAVTWNKPSISSNSLPVYSRFQDFMLRNAFRGSESFLTARAVYDGGESKVQSRLGAAYGLPYFWKSVLTLWAGWARDHPHHPTVHRQ